MSQSTLNTTTLYYGPYRQGFDTNEWRPLTGSPIMNLNRIELPDGGSIIHYSDILKGNITFSMNFSVAPGSGDAVSSVFGLYQPSTGAAIAFVASPGGLVGRISDGVTTTDSSNITWNNAWTDVDQDFRISWESGLIKFFINNIRVATLTGDEIPTVPLSLYFSDDSSDATSLGTIDVKGSQGIYTHLATSDTLAPSEPIGRLLTHQHITLTEAITISIVGP